MWDPNWLLSTTAQSAAALVAIIAGFLVSRVLALASERNSLVVKLNEVHDELRPKQQRLEELKKWKMDKDVAAFIAASAEDVARTHGDITLEELVAKHETSGLTIEELRPHYERAVEAAKRAYQLLEPVISSMTTQPPSDIEEVLTVLEVPAELEPIYGEVYYSLRDSRDDPSPSNFLGALPDPIPIYKPWDLSNAWDTQVYLGTAREIDQLQVECRIMEAQEERLVKHLKAIETPKGIWPGVGVLGFFAVSGILVPITVLATGPISLSVEARCSIFVSFSLGLAALMVYLVWSIRQLSK